MAGRRRWSVLGWLLALVVVGAAGFLAGRAVFRGPSVPVATQVPVATVAVRQGQVGKSLPASATVTWPASFVVVSAAGGTVTGLPTPQGTQVAAGTTLAEVDLVPVVVLPGATPMFRDLGPGVQGRDVSQLRAALAGFGYAAGDVSEVYDEPLAAAVSQWQRDRGLPALGSVARGEVVFAPTLPATLFLADKLKVGASLAPGEEVATLSAGTPEFALRLAREQATILPDSGTAVVTGTRGQRWSAAMGPAVSDEKADGVVIGLDGDGGKPVCGEECATLAVTRELRLAAKVIVVPEVKGLVVPRSAVRASGSSSEVVLPDGTGVPVMVKGSGGGLAVVEGVAEGTQVRLLAQG